MILIWLTCIQDYIILLLSELTALRSHFLCQKLEYSHILKVMILLVQIMKSVDPDRRRKKSVTRKQHNIHAHYVNEKKIYILKPKKKNPFIARATPTHAQRHTHLHMHMLLKIYHARSSKERKNLSPWTSLNTESISTHVHPRTSIIIVF